MYTGCLLCAYDATTVRLTRADRVPAVCLSRAYAMPTSRLCDARAELAVHPELQHWELPNLYTYRDGVLVRVCTITARRPWS